MAAIAALVGCANSPTGTYRADPYSPQYFDSGRSVRDHARLFASGWSLRKAAVPFCGSALRYSAGMFAFSPEDFRTAIPVERARSVMGPELLKITSVAPHSPAAQAGLQVGDEVIDDDGRPVTEETIFQRSTSVPQSASDTRSCTAVVRRQSKLIAASMTCHAVCSWRFKPMFFDDRVGVYHDPQTREVIITTGALRAMDSDEHLRALLAHEMAHAILGHQRPYRLQWSEGRFKLDLTKGALEYTPREEIEADCLAVRLLASAGRPFADYSQMMGKLASGPHDSFNYQSDHGINAARLKALQSFENAVAVNASIASASDARQECRSLAKSVSSGGL